MLALMQADATCSPIRHRGDQAAEGSLAIRHHNRQKGAGRSGGTRPRRRPRYVAGLIPEAGGAMPADMSRTLTELRDLIEQRATTLAGQAVQAGQPWVQRLGPPPTDLAQRAAWEQQVRTIAAYRDRYGITGTDPPDPHPVARASGSTTSAPTPPPVKHTPPPPRPDGGTVPSPRSTRAATSADNRPRPGTSAWHKPRLSGRVASAGVGETRSVKRHSANT